MAVQVLRDVRPWDSSIYGFRDFKAGDVADGPIGVWLAAVCPADVTVTGGSPDVAVDRDGNPLRPVLPEESPAGDGQGSGGDGESRGEPIPPATDLGDGTAGPFDPAEHTGPDVIAYVKAHPDEADAIVAAERAGKGRSTVLAALASPGL